VDKTTDQIESEIKQTRDDLRSNFQELETKVKSVIDWRRYFEKNPTAMIAGAFTIGAVVALVGRGRGRRDTAASSSHTANSISSKQRKNGNVQPWNRVKSVLVGVAAAKVTGLLWKTVPGLQDLRRMR
jgi:hypothetical protein